MLNVEPNVESFLAAMQPRDHKSAGRAVSVGIR